MKWDWGKYKNTVFIFDRECNELLTKFERGSPEFKIPQYSGIVGIRLYEPKHWLHGKWITIVNAYQFNDEYYSKFPIGHKAPNVVIKCWRMLQIEKLLNDG